MKWNTGLAIMKPQSMVKMMNNDKHVGGSYPARPPQTSVSDAIDLFVGLPKSQVTFESAGAFNTMKGTCVIRGHENIDGLMQMVDALSRMVDFSVSERHEVNSYTGDDMGPQTILEWVTSDGSLMQAIHGQMNDEKLQREIEKVQAKKRQVALTDATNAKIQAARVLAERTAQYEEEAMF